MHSPFLEELHAGTLPAGAAGGRRREEGPAGGTSQGTLARQLIPRHWLAAAPDVEMQFPKIVCFLRAAEVDDIVAHSVAAQQAKWSGSLQAQRDKFAGMEKLRLEELQSLGRLRILIAKASSLLAGPSFPLKRRGVKPNSAQTLSAAGKCSPLVAKDSAWQNPYPH